MVLDLESAAGSATLQDDHITEVASCHMRCCCCCCLSKPVLLPASKRAWLRTCRMFLELCSSSRKVVCCAASGLLSCTPF